MLFSRKDGLYMQSLDLQVEVEDGHISVTMAGTHFHAVFAKSPDPKEQTLIQLPIVVTDHSAAVGTADFERMAWHAANTKARELGWID